MAVLSHTCLKEVPATLQLGAILNIQVDLVKVQVTLQQGHTQIICDTTFYTKVFSFNIVHETSGTHSQRISYCFVRLFVYNR